MIMLSEPESEVAYQVTLYTEFEKAKWRQNVEEMGCPVADLAMWDGTTLRMSFAKPRSNLATRKEWIEMLAQAVLGCRRKDGGERGMRKEEFLAVIDELYSRTEESINRYQHMHPDRPRSYWTKEWTQSNRRGDYDRLTVHYGTTGGLIGGLFHREVVQLRKRLGW